MLTKAISYACRAHGGQWRKDKQTPYVAHPVRVMMIVCRDFGVMDETILSASVLHDIIEDTTRDYESISFHFGTQVADLVAVLSKDPRLPEPVREASYDDQLRSGPWAARLIKLADCLDNFQDALDDTMQSRAREKAIRALELVQPDDPPALHQAAEILHGALNQNALA
ncbi:MAG: bifunctional (p)ppGpp synthetase/guanosine-3',5'-bis(diphosphate) 3'-pyrophosphohydrolase [Planctomycetaceae bacterium]|nr:bifunctional (p)ppGpp synthetase/guanosine-3',5'-bis(diphosphate) 3'-pyrophosphohydrolase [Planctomycetaceae bacterium]